jgi:hypothetical protein
VALKHQKSINQSYSVGTTEVSCSIEKNRNAEFNKANSAKVGSIIILKVYMIYCSAQPKKQNT